MIDMTCDSCGQSFFEVGVKSLMSRFAAPKADYDPDLGVFVFPDVEPEYDEGQHVEYLCGACDLALTVEQEENVRHPEL